MASAANRIIRLLTVTIVSIQLVTSALISWDSGCGSTKGCFPKCTTGCEYLVTWTTSGSNNTFTLQAEESDTDKYLAVGFSKDRRMGDDSVVGCIVPGATVQSYYNEGIDIELLSTPSLGLSSSSVSQSNGVITCSFTRALTGADDKYFDLNNDYILMLVIGEHNLEEDDLYDMEKHDKIPWMSDGKVDFNSNSIYDSYKLNSPAVKLHDSMNEALHEQFRSCCSLHGCIGSMLFVGFTFSGSGIMMVLAWLLLAVVGTVTARYNKDMLPEEKLFGTKVWLQIHRGAMVVAVVFVVIGFISIFVEVEGYSQIVTEESKEAVKAHPVLGIVVTILCVLNPIMALFQPDDDHRFRWIFNWVHLGVVVIAQILAVVTVMLGYVLERAMLPNKAIYVTITHLLVIAIICGALEVHKWYTSRRNKQVDKEVIVPGDMEMREQIDPPKPSNIPFILLLVLGGFLIGSSLALLVIIADN